MKLRAVLIVEYDANPSYYDTSDPVEMAKIDEDNWRNDPMMLLSSFEDDEFKVTVTPA